jgi:hypothetical protein
VVASFDASTIRYYAPKRLTAGFFIRNIGASMNAAERIDARTTIVDTT